MAKQTITSIKDKTIKLAHTMAAKFLYVRSVPGILSVKSKNISNEMWPIEILCS